MVSLSVRLHTIQIQFLDTCVAGVEQLIHLLANPVGQPVDQLVDLIAAGPVAGQFRLTGGVGFFFDRNTLRHGGGQLRDLGFQAGLRRFRQVAF